MVENRRIKTIRFDSKNEKIQIGNHLNLKIKSERYFFKIVKLCFFSSSGFIKKVALIAYMPIKLARQNCYDGQQRHSLKCAKIYN